jgi:peptidoglycan hydrolase CwlO-like protein
MVSLLKTTRRRSLFILLCLIIITIFLTKHSFTLAEDSCGQNMECWSQKIDEYTNKIQDLQGQQKTLASTISLLNSKINLTLVQISKTEQEITDLEDEIAKLSLKIGELEKSLTEISKVLTSRIGATYESSYIKPAYLLFSSDTFSSLLTSLKYLQVAQAHDKNLLFNMEKQKELFDEQKSLKEQKQKELEDLRKTLEDQKITLAKNKADKQALLEVTKNDEKKYQDMLAAARAELEAIQSIIAGKGQETEVGEVTKNQRIASIISGPSPCSSGTHLHFEVDKNGAHQDPTGWLKNIPVSWDNSPDGQFSFSGSWDWPIDEPVRVTQGYGMTYWARIGWYGGGPHTGIDIDSETSNTVKAVQDGTLYRGSIACGGGTLRYVHVKHKDDGLDTYYLHVNYY